MPVQLIWIEAHFPSLAPVLAGFIILQHDTRGSTSFVVNLLKDWRFVPTQDDQEVLTEMEGFVRSMLEEDFVGGMIALQEASNTLRFSVPLQLVGFSSDIHTLSRELGKILLTPQETKS